MSRLEDIEVEFVSLVDKAAVRDPSNPTEPQRFILYKRERGADHDTTPKGGNVQTAEELSAALEKAETERDELTDKVAKLEKKLAKKDKGEPEKLDKSALPPEVREELEKAERERDELKKQAEEAAEIAKSERDARVTREFVSKAESDFASVGGDPKEFGKLLKTCSEKLEKDDFDALETRLRAADEQVRKSALYAELGKGGDPAPGSVGNEHAERIAKAAVELRKADPSLSAYDAEVQAMRQDPEFQREYLASVR